MNKEFRYNSNRYTIAGIIYLLLGISYIVFYILLVSSRAYITWATLIFLFGALIFIVTGILFINFSKVNCIRIDTYGLSVYRGLIGGRINTKYSDIKIARRVGNNLRMGLLDGSEIIIRLNELSIQDVDELLNILKDNLDSLVIKDSPLL